MSKNIIIGIGNILFCDDGIGVFAAHYLEKNYSFEPAIDILDGGTIGIGLMRYFEEYDSVLLLDTISLASDVGSIYTLPSSELLDLPNYKNTAHEVEVVDMLQSSILLDKCAEVSVYGVVPSDIVTMQIGLSSKLEQYFELYIATIIDYIKKLNIEVRKTGNYSLQQVIKTLNS
ncbi:MAG: hydrogenase maturation protease [Helicobacteraceae bacterium]|nr:hydrogenase maturation protease [Helicobacteraceae bacterium]